MSDWGRQKNGEETLTRNLRMEVMTDQSDHEVESVLRVEEQEQEPMIDSLPSLGRQSSIYSITLDEFKNTLTGSNYTNCGSMNMDEFLNSIWTAEDNEAQAQNANTVVPTAAPRTSVTNINTQYQFGETSKERGNIARQMSLTRQGSAPLCLKTVEQVWSEINRTQQSTNNFPRAGSKQRETTYGEMTLVDFLVKAGVVREEDAAPVQPTPPYPQPHLQAPAPQPQPQPLPQYQSQLPMYVNCDSTAASSFMVLGCAGAGTICAPPPLKALPQTRGGNVAGLLSGGKSSPSAYQPTVSCYGERMTIGGCGTKSLGQMSPVSSDGICTNKPQKKLVIDGLVERVTEKCQKRMIKNRESAARSRAKKNIYTKELEVELNHLKGENAYLRHTLAELESKFKPQHGEAAKTKARAKAKDRLGLSRRSYSCP